MAGQVQLNTWQHFVFMKDAAGNRTIWVDGVQVASAGGAAPLEPLDGIDTIGAEGPNNANSFNGIVDEFAIFSEVLDEDQIAALAAGAIVPEVLFTDEDMDGMDDNWELANGLDPTDDSDAAPDPDGDTLTNLQEYERRTNPNEADTDDDGLNDNVETNTGTWVDANDTSEKRSASSFNSRATTSRASPDGTSTMSS